MKPRLIFWWSHGSTSTAAITEGHKLLKNRYPEHEVEIVTILLQEEHEDNHETIFPAYKRLFSLLTGVDMKVITNEKYKGESGYGSVDEVIKKARYMSGPSGARCTKELKKQVRLDYQRPGDVHVFGFHCNEEHRLDNLLDSENELEVECPLIELGISKEDAIELLKGYSLPIPVMYQLGYNNNNCIGCLKATGAGYWNKIRVDFPDVFEKRSRQEELLGVSLISISANKLAQQYPDTFIAMLQESKNPNSKYKISIKSNGQIRMPLRFLPPDLGDHKSELGFDCGIFCEKDSMK